MRKYDRNNLYLCYIKNYSDYPNRKFNIKEGFIYKNMYFSVFLKVNANSFFDLNTGEYYTEKDDVILKTLSIFRIKSKKTDVSERQINRQAQKYYKLIDGKEFA